MIKEQQTVSGKGGAVTRVSKGGLQKQLPALRHFSTALTVLTELGPERMTTSQATFFLYVAMADIAGRPATFTEIKEAVGPVINKSLHTTYKLFLDESRWRGQSRDKGLGWVMRETDPRDNRRKFLRLTAQGRKVINELGIALNLEGATKQ